MKMAVIFGDVIELGLKPQLEAQLFFFRCVHCQTLLDLPGVYVMNT